MQTSQINRTVELLIIFGLIVLNGIFSMAEMSMVASKKFKLDNAKAKGSKGAETALELAEHPTKLLSTVQIGITLIGILLGIYSGENLTHDLEYFLSDFEFIKIYSHQFAVGIIVLMITFLSILFGELLPKRIGLSFPEPVAIALSRPMKWISIATSPFVALLTASNDVILNILGIKKSLDSSVTEEEIKSIIKESAEVGEIEEIEQDIVQRVFILGDRKISSLMTHRNEMVFLSVDENANHLRDIINKDMHSIYPVFDDQETDIVGIVSFKSIFKHINDDNFKLADLIHPPQYLPESQSAYETLKQFKKTNIHYGLVVDEYGQVQGILTLNDLLKALVGDVSEFYEEEFSYIVRDDKSLLIDGQYPLHELFRKLELPHLTNTYQVDTLSGLILEELRSMPVTGQKIQWRDFEFEIVDMDQARIDKVIIRKNKLETKP